MARGDRVPALSARGNKQADPRVQKAVDFFVYLGTGGFIHRPDQPVQNLKLIFAECHIVTTRP
jgi:hypothetical protein